MHRAAGEDFWDNICLVNDEVFIRYEIWIQCANRRGELTFFLLSWGKLPVHTSLTDQNDCFQRPLSFSHNFETEKVLSSLILNNIEKEPRLWTVLWKRCIVEHVHKSILFPSLPSPPSSIFWPQLAAVKIATSRPNPYSLSGRTTGFTI